MLPIGLVAQRSRCGGDVVTDEAEADHAADAAAVRGGLQHLLARVGQVSCRVQARHRGLADGVGLDEVAHPGRMRNRHQTERGERLGADPEWGADDDRIGVDPISVDQLDGDDVPVVAGDQPPHRCVDDGDAGGAERVEPWIVRRDAVVQHQRELGGELAEQAGRVQTHRMGDDLDDAPVADLVAVTERTVDDVATPVLGDTLDVGQHVDQAGRRHASVERPRCLRRRGRRGNVRPRVG